MNYDEMLNRAIEKTDSHSLEDYRFDPPIPSVEEDGSFTIYTNILSTSKYLNRDVNELLTFFQDELATSGSLVNERARLKGFIL